MQNDSVTAKELAEKLSVNEKTIKRALIKLKELGIIERIGADKNGHWVVISDKTDGGENK